MVSWRNFRTGSPPHMRGKATNLEYEVDLARITPRTCGEKRMLRVLSSGERGSPPHMRGKAPSRYSRNALIGITPAHAGKSVASGFAQSVPGDHPRACGEKTLHHNLVSGNWGSPPHMRGKGPPALPAPCITGITPAHAGKRIPPASGSARGWDHPRTCGEKFLFQHQDFLIKGSPPHMRGKADRAAGGWRQKGITPAHAGKRSQAREAV